MYIADQLPAVVTALQPLINHYGYFAVAVLLFLEDFGVPVPGETTLIAAAVFAGLGQLNIALVALVAIAASVLGDNVGYAIGRYGGHPLVERFGKYVFMTPKRIAKLEAFFKRNGARIVIVARFINLLRQTNGIIAGLSEMSWPKFLAYNLLGATLWVGAWSALGYLGGSHIAVFLRYQLYASIALAAIVAAHLIHRHHAKLATFFKRKAHK